MWHVTSGRAIGRRKEVIYMPPIAYFVAVIMGRWDTKVCAGMLF